MTPACRTPTRPDTVFANQAPAIAGDLAITVSQGQAVALTAADLDEADPDNAPRGLAYTVTGQTGGQVLVNGAAATSFTELQLDAGQVSFLRTGLDTAAASFTLTLRDGSGTASASATVNANVVTATGGSDDLTFGNAADTVNALSGSDVIRSGDDLLLGGARADVFVFASGSRSDRIVDFRPEDVIEFAGGAVRSFEAVLARTVQVGADTRIDLGGGDLITLENVGRAQLQADDFRFV